MVKTRAKYAAQQRENASNGSEVVILLVPAALGHSYRILTCAASTPVRDALNTLPTSFPRPKILFTDRQVPLSDVLNVVDTLQGYSFVVQ